jgi:TPR repeat protein
MRKSIIATLAASLLVAAPAALADVKSGVDAWNQGDYARAVNEWRPLAISGNADAQFNLGQAYKLGRGVPVDLPVALEWFRKASDKGHEKAADNYGLLLFQQGRREEALPYIKASADRGEARAQYVYATALFNGDLAPKDWVRAYALMTRASRAGVTQATTSLEQMNQYIPEDQRREGLAMAANVSAPPTPRLPAAAPAPAPAPAPAMARTSVPPLAQAELPATSGPTPRPPVIKREAPTPPTPTIPVRPPVERPAQTAAASAAIPAAPTRAPAPGGRWRVQLGAFKEQGRAQALWTTLRGKISGLSAFQPSYVAAGGMTRLLVGPIGSSAEAQNLCARIKPSGTPCIPSSQ